MFASILRKKTAVLGAVAAMLVSSVVGATTLRTPDATATDSSEAIEGAETTVGDLRNTIVEVADPVLTGGVGESLVLVIAAQVPTSDVLGQLAEVNAPFGELQGFAFDDSSNYELSGVYVREGPDSVEVACTTEIGCPDGVATVRELQPVNLRYVALDALASVPVGALGTFSFIPGQSILVSGFRTKQGAEEFVDLNRAMGVTELTTVQARKRGGGDIGLGQEPHPDGSGPLLGPLGDQEAFQQ